MAENLSDSDMKSTVSKYQAAEKSKLCDISRGMCDVYGKGKKENVYKRDHMGLSQQVWFERAVYGVEINLLSVKENVFGAAVI